MPAIYSLACYECDLVLSVTEGGVLYARDASGEWEVCPHPDEFSAVQKITGMGYFPALLTGRLKTMVGRVCLQCFCEFEATWPTVGCRCPDCGSARCKRPRTLLRKRCPKCGQGVIEKGLGTQRLDPDWRTLPCPQVVKDLVEMEWQLVGSLAESSSARPLSTTSTTLPKLRAMIFEQRLNQTMRDLLSWFDTETLPSYAEEEFVSALPALLEQSPALAELLTLSDGQCAFAPSISTETRRGIRNYVRRWRPHLGIIT